MKFSIEQNQLAKAINIVQRGISSRTTLPILNGILINASNGVLKMSGTDLEIGIVTKVDCEILKDGELVVASRLFGEIIKKLPSEKIDIEVIDGNMNINCNNSKFSIKGQSPDEYPEIPTIDEEKSFSIQNDLLKAMVRQTIFAVAQEETRPILTGELLEIEDSQATLVALDGYRLALKKVKIDYDDEIKIVIPSKTLNEISKIIDDSTSETKISTTDNHILFKIEDTLVTSRLLDGQFLNYKDIIREEYSLEVKVDTREIQNAVERASLLAREGRNNQIKISIEENGKKAVITSESEIGNVHEEIDIEAKGDAIEIGFNSKYILDGIKAIESSELKLYFINDINPCIIRPVNDDNYIYLVLPVRLS